MQTNDYKSSIEIADRVRVTIKTAGWQDILKIINDKIAYYTQKALTEKELNNIYYSQACVEVANMFLSEIDAIIKQGEEADKLKK